MSSDKLLPIPLSQPSTSTSTSTTTLPPLDTITHLGNYHQHQLLTGLNQMRHTHTLTDVTLILNGRPFHAHRAILAACSDYFRAMFTDPMVESRRDTIHLNGIPTDGLQLLLDYIYTSRLDLTPANIQNVLAAASHTQMVAVVRAAAQYLQTQIEVENCVDVATIAENYSLVDLKRAVYSFVCGNWQRVSTTSDFYRLSPEQILYVLSREFMFDCSELELLRVVLTWLFYDESYSLKVIHAQTIFKHINFYEIVKKKLDLMLDEFFQLTEGKKHDHPVYQMIIAEARLPSNILQLNLCFNAFNSRGMEQALVKIGGFGSTGMTNEITYSPTTDRTWRHLTTIPHVDQCNYGTAVLHNDLYVVGGCFNQYLQEVIHPFGFRYSATRDSWTRIAPMSMERCRFSLNVCGEGLYAVGGATEVEGLEGGEGTNSCERYDPISDRWHHIAAIPEYRTRHAGATYTTSSLNSSCSAGTSSSSSSTAGGGGGTTNYLYVSGGMHKDQIRDTLYAYNTRLDTWSVRAAMLTPRADHFMLTYGSKLYVCGGWREDSDGARFRRQVDTIDAYNTVTDCWEVVTRVPTPRYHAGVVAVRELIYFIGGFHTDDLFFKDTAPIECYNVVTDTWTIGEKNPQDYWEHSCVSLYIPKSIKKTTNTNSSSLPSSTNS